MKTSADYSNLPESALVALAQLVLKRAHLSLLCSNAEQAIRIIRGVRPAPPRKAKLHIKPVYDLCCVCYKPMVTGTPCDSLGRRHAHCEAKDETHKDVQRCWAGCVTGDSCDCKEYKPKE